jgi:hypothetical protein
MEAPEKWLQSSPSDVRGFYKPILLLGAVCVLPFSVFKRVKTRFLLCWRPQQVANGALLFSILSVLHSAISLRAICNYQYGFIA